MSERAGFVMFHEWRYSLEYMPAEDVKRFLLAMFEYSQHGTLPNFNGAEMGLFSIYKSAIDRAAENHERRRQRGRDNANQRWHPNGCNGTQDDAMACNGMQNDANNAMDSTEPKPTVSYPNQANPTEPERSERPADKPPRAPRFTPPTVEEVKTYCLENGLSLVDAGAFVDFYGSKGWKVGTGSMRDWKAAVRNWNRREQKEQAAKTVTTADRIYTAADYLEGW